jgi:hypothetical protein
MEKKFWLSWITTVQQGEFELHSPWWHSGTAQHGQIFCAAVKAVDADAARVIIHECYDNPPFSIEWRFVDEKADDWSPFCDRFPRARWMAWE